MADDKLSFDEIYTRKKKHYGDTQAALGFAVDEFMMQGIKIGEYTIKPHDPLPDGREVFWLEKDGGEGMTVDKDNINSFWESNF